MYAVIEAGGKQFRVEKGDIIDVEVSSSKIGDKITFDKVLLIGEEAAIKIGSPYLSKGIVIAESLQEVKGPKVVAFKYKKRKGIRRKVGHRQRYLRVKILDIESGK